MIAFLHIPKTGGRALSYAVERTFDGAAHFGIVCGQHRRTRLVRTARALEEIGNELCRGECLSMRALARTLQDQRAKAFFGTVTNLTDLSRHVDGVRYATWLRNPYERTMSHFAYVSRRLDASGQLDFRRFCRNERNVQSNWVSRRRLGARSALAKYAFVGVFEKYDQEMRNLSRDLGLPGLTPDAINVNPDKPMGTRYRMTDEQMAIIERYNRKDIALYNSVVEQKYPELCI
jgi:hypothetical protein